MKDIGNQMVTVRVLLDDIIITGKIRSRGEIIVLEGWMVMLIPSGWVEIISPESGQTQTGNGE
mgnify:CR=1 FL=1